MTTLFNKVILLVLLGSFMVSTIALTHQDNPFYYENADVDAIVNSDGTMVKKLNRE